MDGDNSNQNIDGLLDEDNLYKDDYESTSSEESLRPYMDENVRNAIELR